MARKKRDPVQTQLGLGVLMPTPPQPRSQESYCLSCSGGCVFCQPHRFLTWPVWFKPVVTTPRSQTDNSQKGKHPTGHLMASGQDEGCGETCGGCGNLQTQPSFKGSGKYRCGLIPIKSPVRSVRKTWAGCEEWRVTGEDPATPSQRSPRRG